MPACLSSAYPTAQHVWAVAPLPAVGKADCLRSSSRFSGLRLAVLLFPVAAHLVQEGIPLS